MAATRSKREAEQQFVDFANGPTKDYGLTFAERRPKSIRDVEVKRKIVESISLRSADTWRNGASTSYGTT